MELRAVTISEGQSGPAGEGCEFVTELELTRPGGGTLCVRQTGPEGVDIVGLAGAYFGKR
jgi:hypothetical protein